MGMFGKLIGAVIETVTIPVAVVADVVTLGGAINEKGETYTGSKIERIVDDLDGAAEDATDGDW